MTYIRDYRRNLASGMTEKLIRIRRNNLKRHFQDFTETSHRMQVVKTLDGVTYINDSKATNVNATYFALQSIDKQIVWIAGGGDNETDYWELMSSVRQKVEAIIMIGKHNDKLVHIFSSVIKTIVTAENMNEAVRLAKGLSDRETAVLLSPAAPADEKYIDYQDRGRQFIAAVKAL